MARFLRLSLAGLRAVRDRSAALLGARLREPAPRRWRFLAGCAGLFLAALLAPPPLAVGVLVFALWLLGAVYWVWVANETKRGRIAKKIDDTRPDDLPDLRDLALLTALALPFFLPLLLAKAHACFGLFLLKGERDPVAWIWFLLDKTYLHALPDTFDVGPAHIAGVHGSGIDYLPGWHGVGGRGLVLLAYGFVYYILLQGLLRIWQIHRDVREGIAGVVNDPDMAVRLGRRAVRPLLRVWDAPEALADAAGEGVAEKERQKRLTALRAHTLTALGRIGDPAALPVLRAAAIGEREPAVREAALAALGDFNSGDTADVLGRVLRDMADTVGARAAAAASLGRLTCPEATEPLLAELAEIDRIDWRYHEHASVRKEVVRAVGSHLAARRTASPAEARAAVDRAVGHLLANGTNTSLLEDIYLRVRNKTATALAQLGDARAVGPLTERLGDMKFQNPELLQDTAKALGRLLGELRGDPTLDAAARATAVAELQGLLEKSPNESVREAAAEALGASGAVETVEALVDHFRAALQASQEKLTKALEAAACALAPQRRQELEELARRTGRLWSQRRRQVLLDATRPLADRLAAARELGEYQDERGLKALALVADNPEVSEDLRAACRQAIARIRAVKG